MSQIKNIGENCIGTDQGIKLFGRTIPLYHTQISTKSHLKDCNSDKTKSKTQNPIRANSIENSEINNSEEQEKVFKKPDKIIPCPRCKSMETKFCYFNNYNVNQPRHFCKNCQRYWTAGGSMRNVPVGAGRRKNKHLASQFRHMMASGDVTNITTDEQPSSTEKVLRFCPENVGALQRQSTSLEGDLSAPVPARVHTWPCYPVVSQNSQQFFVSGGADSGRVQWLQGAPTVYWGCLPIWAGNAAVLPSLGKHSREELDKIDEVNGGLEHQIGKENSVVNNGSVYKRLGYSKIGQDYVLYSSSSTTSPVLEANPAAVSRSHSFQEST